MPDVHASPGGPISDYGEDDLLARLFPLVATGRTDVLGPGDDAAIVAVEGPVVATTDAMVRGRDWRDEWSTASDVAAKAVVQNLADIAAMGARPVAILVTLLMDPQTPTAWVLELAAALGEQCRRYDVTIAGGDLSSAPAGFVALSVTALGELPLTHHVGRSGARPGDTVAVCGSLGRSHVGFMLLSEAADAGRDIERLPQEALAHHRRPTSPLSQGIAAAAAGATAMMDVSDGLSRDAHRLARASEVAIDLHTEALGPDLNWAERFVSRAQARTCVLDGGEEHSLVACFPGEPPPWWRAIGDVIAGEGVTLDGKQLPPGGWDHFSG